MSEHLPDFSGKALLVFDNESTLAEATAIRFQDWARIGGEIFLQGIEIEIAGKPNCLAGILVRIAWTSVQRFYEFNSVEELQSTLAQRGGAGLGNLAAGD